MEEPLAGWGVLRSLLKPGGLMRIGLYSRAGRHAVAVAQNAARRGGYLSTREDILRFRRDCPHLCDRETLLHLSQLQDYYHLNMYRDLLFPAREHRFDLAQIGDMLDELNLVFEGFYVSTDVLTKYRSMFRDDRHATHLEVPRIDRPGNEMIFRDAPPAAPPPVAQPKRERIRLQIVPTEKVNIQR